MEDLIAILLIIFLLLFFGGVIWFLVQDLIVTVTN